MSDKGTESVSIVGMRELSRETAHVIELLHSNDKPIVITKQGKPIATLAPIDEADAQNLALSLAPEIHETSSSANVDFSPRELRSIDEVSEELAEEALQTSEGREALAEFSKSFVQQRTQVSNDVAQVFADAQAQAQRVMDGAFGSVRILQEHISKGGEPAAAKTTGKRVASASTARAQKAAKGKRAAQKSR